MSGGLSRVHRAAARWLTRFRGWVRFQAVGRFDARYSIEAWEARMRRRHDQRED